MAKPSLTVFCPLSMKKAQLVFSGIMVPVDYLAIMLAALSAYFLRYSKFYTTNIREVVFNLSFKEFFGLALSVALGWLFIFALSGLYKINQNPKLFDEIRRAFLACSTSTLLLIAVFFFSRELFSSRFIILAAWLFAIVYVSLGRVIVRLLQRFFYKIGAGVNRVILVGNGRNETIIQQEFQNKPRLGFKVMAIFKSAEAELLKKIQELKILDELDEIIQTNPDLPKEQVARLIDWCQEYHLSFKYTADILNTPAFNLQVDTLAGIPIAEIKKTNLDGWGRIIKRIFDVIASVCGLILLAPLFLIISIVIKTDSKGPIFFRQPRIGANGTTFKLYKFRSMIHRADELKIQLQKQNERADGPLFKISSDPRITKIGKFLRKFSLDELPQLVNALRGEMSLVGPRPHLPDEVGNYQRHHKKLLNIKPGLTGLAQVSGRSNLSFEEEVRLDVFYIENWTFKLDLIVLIKTPFVVLSAKTAC
jgi:exopolysaccharide biosynthesis polyprenyl glycosylphosphotransferase